ncbi:hypothetical protein MTR67_030765 [Solanum verrucosum]|uniref:Uncharacterized protein n=1 Tax=Solanum verrucosum TaxID=315347 RepID=A0AAF0U177_SOLVR|nr:hypothetical protein MTR67_030765 [Solanum verrucosum]
MLKKCMGAISLIVPTEDIGIKDSLYYEEISVQILDRQVRESRTKEVASSQNFVGKSVVEELLENLKRLGRRDTHIASNLEKFQIKVLILLLALILSWHVEIALYLLGD